MRLASESQLTSGLWRFLQSDLQRSGGLWRFLLSFELIGGWAYFWRHWPTGTPFLDHCQQ
jgi:hypothetical protein